ncbi:mitochondrial 54S ribosomal protein uL24m [Thermothelomyces heterothallicus CBS 202.75]|uniref:mitochondrial 54S ribosomal protein uL24m n=1 Tax=Thermothelomyces heterothallicus CBS 202.75 TaxID=1149848 RepID=UPI003742A8C7
MDKILRRVRMAERQVARRTEAMQRKLNGLKKDTYMRELKALRQEAGLELNQAIKNRHQDLELGPLRPNRDVSDLTSDFHNYWGSISPDRALLQHEISDEQKAARSAWAGGPTYLCLAVGDRVVVTEGEYKGRIAKIVNINKASMTVELDGNVGITNVKVPSFLVKHGSPRVQQMKQFFPISSVRLVHPLPDPATGTVRDVIIRELKPIRITHDRPTRKVFFSRLVPGLNVQIPWPKTPPKVKEEYPGDTLRLDVEERTFVPTLLRPPMPETVIDELRNKYSKFRTRHTPEYIAKVEALEAEKKARRKGARAEEMLLPLQEYNRKMRELRRQRGKPELTEEMLEKIGEVIAKNKLLRSQGALPAPTAQAAEEVDKVQKAVEQLSLGGDAQTTTGGEQPTA